MCTRCTVEHVWLSLGDGTPIYGRLYIPSRRPDRLPVVVVRHGYLANLAVVQAPWAADLIRLGVAAFLIDGRGHGWSGGSWWPPARHSEKLADVATDIKAAVAYLRSRTSLIDSSRIALVGHSDGGTSAIMAASADWDIAATVSFSASAAPWEYLNYVAPADLLLLYGTEDRFILQHTDELLIANATRGYLDGEGAVGRLSDGSARRLVRVAGQGHIGLIYSEAARREALEWIAESFGISPHIVLSSACVRWVVMGTILLGLLLLSWNGPLHMVRLAGWGFGSAVPVAAITAAWACGVWLSARWHTLLWFAPAREGNVVVGTLVAECVLMIGLGLLVIMTGRAVWQALPRTSLLAKWFGHGVVMALVFQSAFEVLLKGVYESALDFHRLVLFSMFLPITVLAFAAFEATTRLAAGNRLLPIALSHFSIAVVTAIMAERCFPRMSASPIYLLAATLALMGAYQAGRHPGGVAGAAAFGAVIYARCMSFVCPLY